jgi:hypothetical protein
LRYWPSPPPLTLSFGGNSAISIVVRSLVSVCAPLLLVGSGCGKPAPLITTHTDSKSETAKADPQLPQSDSDVVKLFRSRATTDEQKEFDAALANRDEKSQVRAVECVLFKLSIKELFPLGITATAQSGDFDWCVAWSHDTNEVSDAIESALEPVGIGWYGSMGHGHAGWYVRRQDFFAARKALNESAQVPLLGIKIVTPRLKLR